MKLKFRDESDTEAKNVRFVLTFSSQPTLFRNRRAKKPITYGRIISSTKNEERAADLTDAEVRFIEAYYSKRKVMSEDDENQALFEGKIFYV